MALINTDIYNIRESVEELKKQYIPEDDETLALGIYGYIGDIESKKIQTAIMMVGELENEVFPNRAKLDKNIITHAVMQNIEDINATPAYMTIIMGIAVEDLEKYMSNNQFIIDKDCKFVFSNENTSIDFEYHLDYDIILSKSTNSNSVNVYAAVYNMDRDNPISSIDNPYLQQPYTVVMNNKQYVFLQCTLHQVTTTTLYKQLVTGNIIDNKTITFEFNNQLASFEVVVWENDKEYILTPIFEGGYIDESIDYYCYYTYISSNIIRIKFDRTSYMPGINAEVNINLKTTKGSEGIFSYNEDLYVSISSEKYSYDNVMVFTRPNTNSIGGVDRKSTEELHSIIPKETLSRGSITTETDLMNYFNLINTKDNHLEIVKKVDNQIERIYYSYFVMKNSNGNIVPSNTINLSIPSYAFDIYEDNGTLILPAGTKLSYSDSDFTGYYTEDDDSEFLYSTLYTILINQDPLYCAFYLTVINETPYLVFEYINQDSELQFISQNITFKRNLIIDNTNYKLSFTARQNINKTLYPDLDNITQEQIIDYLKDIIKAVIVFYKDDVPYRYAEIELNDYDEENYDYTFGTTFETDNLFDINNNIKILNLGVVGETTRNYGYLNDSTEAHIYVLTKFEDGEYGRHGLDDLVPGYEGYTVTNEYEVYGGLQFFVNYTGLMNCRVLNNDNNYNITSVPVIGYDYIADETKVFDFIDQINYKKMYIDNALYVLENSFEIDFKFYNTYGPSRTYTIDSNGEESIGRIDLELRFKLSLKSSSDTYTKTAIVQDIKDYVEELDTTLGDFHIPNLVSYITDKYSQTINYFGWIGFNNNFDANYQHMFKQDVNDKTICPEFINVRNTTDIDNNIVPDIIIDTVIG